MPKAQEKKKKKKKKPKKKKKKKKKKNKITIKQTPTLKSFTYIHSPLPLIFIK